MTKTERNSVENLMILCPNHHREIDRLRPQDWSAERLMEIKAEHESNCTERDWATEPLLEFFSSLLASAENDAPTTSSDGPRPRLVVVEGPKDSFMVENRSEADAFQVRIEDGSPEGAGNMLHLESETVARLSPGGRWRAGLYARTFGDKGTPTVRIRWQDEGGQEFDAEFPMV